MIGINKCLSVKVCTLLTWLQLSWKLFKVYILKYIFMYVFCSKHFSFWYNLKKKKTFLSELPNFLALDWLGKEFQTVQTCPKKRKNLYLIKLVSKWKRANRKGHTSFFGFDFWDLKNGAFQFSIIFCNRKSKSFFSKMWG